jgi:DNA polymerase kappa
VEVEATRDLTQSIVHVDMDAFVSRLPVAPCWLTVGQYASVEVKRDPTLKGKAFGVGVGVLTTASVS